MEKNIAITKYIFSYVASKETKGLFLAENTDLRFPDEGFHSGLSTPKKHSWVKILPCIHAWNSLKQI